MHEIHDFAANEIAPRAATIDRNNPFRRDLWKKVGDLGPHGMTMLEEYGGTELGHVVHAPAGCIRRLPGRVTHAAVKASTRCERS